MFEDVFSLIRKEDIVLFVGAGLSLKAGYPSGNQLAEILCNDLANELSQDEISQLRNQPLPLVAEKHVQVKNNKRNSLMQILKQVFDKEPIDISNHENIANIPHFKNIISTNYDTLFEKTYQKYNLIINDSDCPKVDNKQTNILKIHGDLSQPESIIITGSDYTRFFDTQKRPVMWNLVKGLIATRSVLFLGYGFEDTNIESIFTKLFETIGKNHKELFLIAPKFKEYRINYLKTYDIKYIDSTAEQFLDDLLVNIKENIKNDYKNRIVETETFNAFCNAHNIAISVSLKQKENIIDKIESLDGRPLNTKITFETNEKIGKKIMNSEFQREFEELENIQGFNFSNNPGIKLNREQLLSFKYSENGIIFHHLEDIQSLYLLQRPNKTGKMSIIAPNGQMYPDLVFEIYGNKSSVTIKIMCAIFTFEANIPLVDKNNQYSGISKFNEYYQNKTHAIFWTKLLYSLFEGGEFVFSFEDAKDLKIKFFPQPEGINFCSQALEYYEFVSKIEEITEVPFSKYESFSDKNYDMAMRILCYLTKKPFVCNFVDNAPTFKINMKELPKISSTIHGDKFIFTQSKPKRKPLVLNEKEFHAKYENIYLPSCSIKNHIQQDNKTYEVELVTDEQNIAIYYSDNPIRQEGDRYLLL